MPSPAPPADSDRLDLLLVEDNPGDARLVEAYLDEGMDRPFDLVLVGTLAEALERSRDGRPDLVLLDLGLPDADGIEAVREMRALETAPALVVLTGLDDDETALEALGEGAQDYLGKDALEARSLRRSIRHSLERHRVARELEKVREELRIRALHDSLTGLPNRTLIDDRLEQALARVRRSGLALGVLMLDLARFKQVNESLGHTAGDRVLKEVGRRLAETVRDEDTVGRWGGDEFVLIFPDLDGPGDLGGVQERLRRALARPCSVGGETVELEVYVGAALDAGSDQELGDRVERPQELIRRADAALVRAKEERTSDFHLFDPREDEERADVLQQEQDLRRGLREEEFEPFYQPIVRLEDGEVWGVEPLARWRHPERGLVTPGEFIELAEETGLIHELGRQISDQAIADVARWSAGGGRLRLTPNVSGRQFERDDMLDAFRERLDSTGLDPARVSLEMTETSLMRASGPIEELRELGVEVLIDDFGTGYSSLDYLRDLPVDGLKIDMSFIQGLGEGVGNSAIVEAILTLGREMELQVIAEGIETEDQLRRLRGMGCRLGQGYLFARPAPAGEMETALRESSPAR